MNAPMRLPVRAWRRSNSAKMQPAGMHSFKAAAKDSSHDAHHQSSHRTGCACIHGRDRRSLCFFNSAVAGRRRIWAANWSAIWYLLSAFAVISYTESAVYVLFAAAGSWLGAFTSMTWLRRGYARGVPERHTPP